MYPILFHVFGFPISSFGLMLAVAFLVGTWLAALRMREIGLDPELASSLLIWCMVGGIGGAKLYFAIDVSLREGLPFTSLLFSRDGITFYGGLIGGFLMGVIGTRVHGVPTVAFANCAALACAVGQAIGRIGCLLVGDDYGRPSDVPWAMAFPEGAPPTLERVHPTQIYESVWLFGVTAFLWARRKKSPFLFGEFMILNGIGRFGVEYFRLNEPGLLGLTEAQIIAVMLIAGGSAGWLYYYRQARS